MVDDDHGAGFLVVAVVTDSNRCESVAISCIAAWPPAHSAPTRRTGSFTRYVRHLSLFSSTPPWVQSDFCRPAEFAGKPLSLAFRRMRLEQVLPRKRRRFI